MVYLDTSVIVAYYCPETLSRQVQDLLREQIKPALSLLTEVELASAVAKKVRSNELSRLDGNRILAKFVSHVDAGLFRVIAVENHHWQLARSWISLFSTPLRTLDALHLAIVSDKELQLVTSDISFFQSAGMLDIDALLID
ncbi:MAG: uncharacterized protein QG552_3924 [Thermodesulfobacteriota bacterium]|nr:uncharacterized protein [Thermodesulfobacteriota bacterium]